MNVFQYFLIQIRLIATFTFCTSNWLENQYGLLFIKALRLSHKSFEKEMQSMHNIVMN